MSVVDYDSYTVNLAVLGAWDPASILGRDALARVRETADGGAVALQAIELLRRTWRMLPEDVRRQAMDALRAVADDIQSSLGEVTSALEMVPIINLVVALVQSFVMIGRAAKGVAEIKRYASNYAHGRAQSATLNGVRGPGQGFYERLECFEFAQYVKVRAFAGDFDRKPAFGTPGRFRDAIFLGIASPEDRRNCKKEMRRGLGDSYGPFNPKCGRWTGASAMMWPWWSAAYRPGPLPRWEGSPPGASFQAGPSPDTNGELIQVQTRLIMDPEHNLRASLSDILGKVKIFHAWWDGKADQGLLPVTRDHTVDLQGAGGKKGAVGKKIDAVQDLDHRPSVDAEAYWYYDANGYIATYSEQPGAALDEWGVELPGGKPEHLACTIAQHNGVLSARAAFAQRRLATLRLPLLVQGLLADHGLEQFDAGARDAIEFARDSKERLLPFPGDEVVGAKKQKFKAGRIPLKFAKPKATEFDVPWGVVAGVGAAVVLGGGAAILATRRKA